MRHNRRILRVGKIATTMNASHAGLAGHRVPAGLNEAIAAFAEVGLVVAEARKTSRADGLTVRWRARVGWGYSSPVVAKGRVYLTDCQGPLPKAKERLLCFDERTGTLLW